jgi:hypothetical protein
MAEMKSCEERQTAAARSRATRPGCSTCRPSVAKGEDWPEPEDELEDDPAPLDDGASGLHSAVCTSRTSDERGGQTWRS